MFDDNYRPQRSWGKVMFLHMCVYVCVILFTGGVLSQHALQVVSHHALQQGVSSWGVPGPRGCLVPGGAWSQGSAPGGSGPRGSAPAGVPGSGGGVWPSVMAFCCGLLLCPSGLVAFWYGLLGAEGHNRRHDTRRPPHQKAPHQNAPHQKATTPESTIPEGHNRKGGVPGGDPPGMATAAGSMHPTGMHPCC